MPNTAIAATPEKWEALLKAMRPHLADLARAGMMTITDKAGVTWRAPHAGGLDAEPAAASAPAMLTRGAPGAKAASSEKAEDLGDLLVEELEVERRKSLEDDPDEEDMRRAFLAPPVQPRGLVLAPDNERGAAAPTTTGGEDLAALMAQALAD